ncbi:protein SpAN precursor [Strongylocentrotus purpuratus]|uniref:Metalloendopeptidase n=1 Tax=Strongylocentrotus purpuratus TaxID=7668 RepID=A0A7M6UX59_STRPU|nr:protein SpAN precursor [Strongylocentrotus purpuratus]
MKLVLLLAGLAALAKCSLAAPAGAQKDIPMETSPPEKPSDATTPGLLKTPKPEPKDEEPTPGAFQGDMMLTDDQLRKVEEAIDDQKAGRKKRKATIYESQRWSYKIIPYVIESSSSGQSSLIRSAMDHWEQNTCLRFEPLTSSHSSRLGHTSYISFFRGNGCWSHVGRSFTNQQQISIGPQCGYFGTIVHEIGHAIGFHHEQSRPDRDEYINVNYENVQEGREHNFAKYTWGSVTSSNVEYDVGSIMHYGGYGFSSNGRPTITTIDPRLNSRLGQRTALSAADIELANRIYECDDVEDCSNADECLNGGYHDADCDCVCPSSYSGDLCQDGGPTVRPADCSYRFTEMTGEITSPNYPNNYDDNTACVYEIEGPYGSTIELTLLDLDIETETLCRYDAVEVRKDDINSIGEKFCGNILPPVQISSSNQMMVSFTSDPSITRRGFKATYVIIIQTTTVFSTTTLQTTPPSTTTLQTTNPSTTTLQTTDTPVIGSCGGTFVGVEGRVASPNYPNDYDNSLQCDYVIEVDDGRRVELIFEDFGLEDETTCRWDSLMINLGDGIKVGMKMCGREYPAASLVSIGNRMELKLKTDGSVNDRGFVASYRAIDL